MPFLLFRSSAGSGKTYTLVKEYLKLVLKKPDEFRHILALTFTNKAAQEMKDRILSCLKEMSQGHQTPMALELATETGLNENNLKNRSQEILRLILHHYSDFSIGTIDSFMHRVIRTFAFDLHLPLDFSVELDHERMLDQAVEQLLRRVGKDTKLTAALVTFMLYKSESNRAWKVDQELLEIGRQLFQEQGQMALESIGSQLIDLESYPAVLSSLRSGILQFEKQTREAATEAVQLIDHAHLDVNSFFHGNSGIGQYFVKLAAGHFDKIIPNSYVTRTVETDTWYSKTVDLTSKQKMDQIKPALLDIFVKINNLVVSKYANYITLQILVKNILPLAVIGELDKELKEIKAENKVLPIGEFNKKIAGTVLQEPVPFVFERLGEWYHHYLIDEFQDTSVLQWYNLLPLVENALSYDHHAIIVGDGKQAIYRWRNGDVAQFAALPELYLPMSQTVPEERRQSLKRHYQEFPLEKNFRTAPEIVKFNNDLYSFLSSVWLDGHPVYKGVEQKSPEFMSGGYVSVEFLAGDEETTYNERQLARTLQIVRDCLSEGFHPGDIAVLCRSNREGSLVSKCLLENGLNVSSSESVLLRNSPFVNALVSALRLIVNPGDQVSRVVVERFIEEHGLEKEFPKELSDGSLFAVPVFELCEKLSRDFGIIQGADAFIVNFLDAVFQYSLSYGPTVSGFLNWWSDNEMKLSVQVPDTLDAVRVLTVHKAKGLEFQVVIYAFANDKVKAGQPGLWVSLDLPEVPQLKAAWVPVIKDLENSLLNEEYQAEISRSKLDFLNVLYVATTRPKERLYVLTGKAGKSVQEPKSVSDLLTLFVNHSGGDPVTNPNFTRGSAERKRSVDKVQEASPLLNEVFSDNWDQRVSVRLNHPADWDVYASSGKRQKGLLVHDFLSGVGVLDEMEELWNRFVSNNGITEEEAVIFKGHLDQLKDVPGIDEFFNPLAEVRNEADILTAEGKVYRPDRIVIYQAKTLLLDYKTGARKDFHAAQLQTYASVIREMGYPGVEGWLLYLDPEPVLQRVS